MALERAFLGTCVTCLTFFPPSGVACCWSMQAFTGDLASFPILKTDRLFNTH